MDIQITTEGQVMTMKDLAWEELRVTRSLENVASAFEVRATVPSNCFDSKAKTKTGPWIQPGAAVSIAYGHLQMLTGYLETHEIERTGTSHSLASRGRSRTAELTDCDIIGGQIFAGAGPAAIAQTLCTPFGIDVIEPGGLTALARFATKAGEKYFDALDRLANLAQVCLRDDPYGCLELYRLDRDTDPDTQVIEDVKETRITCDASKLYTTCFCAGQTQGTANKNKASANQITGMADDDQSLPTGRVRPLFVKLDGVATPDLCYARAAWEMQTRLARMLQIEVQVRGWTWTDSTGELRLHSPGDFRLYNDPEHGINTDTFVVSDVEYSYAPSGGYVSKLILVSPQAFTPEVRGAEQQKKAVKAAAKKGFMEYVRVEGGKLVTP